MKLNQNVTILFSFFVLFFFACTFDYGQSEVSSEEHPDLVMENVEYVRVRSSDPIARFSAERAERYEKRRVMELMNFSFEQFSDKGNTVNASGMAGSASVEIDSGDIFMEGGVRLEVEAEDVAIETYRLEWKGEPRILSTGQDEIVNILQSNGTRFSGTGFQADARNHSWEFSGGVSGIYVYEEKDKPEEAHYE
jgi:LPS export ABC transporter protein LptC